MQKRTPAALLAAIDILLIGVGLCVFALFHHVLPRAIATDLAPASVFAATVHAVGAAADGDLGQGAEPAPSIAGPRARAEETVSAPSVEELAAEPAGAGAPAAGIRAEPARVETLAAAAAEPVEDAGMWGDKFAGKFTGGEVLTTANTYVSENANVTLTAVQANGVTYYVQDVYIRNIGNLRTAFAQDTYGRSITDWVLDMAGDNGAIAAINGDYYGMGSDGVVIRNGELYNGSPDGEVCVLFYDGTMQIIEAADFDADALMAAGAYQAWDFGPSLLSSDGEALTGFRNPISGANPRTAIGYYEPGHYVFVVVDGRQAGYSQGMTLAQLSALFEDLGCSVAYNLDGGKTSAMTFGDGLANQPAGGGRKTSDIIYIGE